MSVVVTISNCPCCKSEVIKHVLSCKDHTVSNEIFEIWECNDCKLRFTQQIPDQHSIGAYYQSDTYISHSDTEDGIVNKAYKIARNYTLNWKMNLVERSLKNKNYKGNLLDIGAGTGAFLNKVAKSNWNITGLEPDAGARKICKDKYNIDLAPAHEIFSLKDQQYDAVTMWHVLEHVHELHEYMEEIKRVLKPNGVVLIALPNYTSEDAEHYKESWAAYDVPRHLYHFAPTAINNLVAQHQMVVEKIKPMWLDAFYIALLSENYKNGKDNLISAVLNGLKSNLVALKDSSKCSSLVYIIRHKL